MSTIIDACTKELLAWVLSESLEIDFVLKTVEDAIAKHGIEMNTETMIHSDQGAHYTSVQFRSLVKDKELRQSMSRRANCWDNAPQESFYYCLRKMWRKNSTMILCRLIRKSDKVCCLALAF